MSRGSNHYQNNREQVLARLKARRDAVIAAGGPALDELRARERANGAAYRKKYPEKVRALERKRGRKRTLNGKTFKTWLCANARLRGRKRGLEATITPSDLDWPTHCPALGIELDYPTRSGERKNRGVAANWPSLDRWDSSKGYVPGNVFVISYRANTLKNNATYEEALKILEYLRAPPRCVAAG